MTLQVIDAASSRITTKPLMMYYCHWAMCKNYGGGPFMLCANVPFEGLSFTNGEPTAY